MSSSSLENTDLAEEIEAINAIYDPDTLTITNTHTGTTSSSSPHPSTLDLDPTTTTSSSTSTTTSTTLKLQIPEHPHLSFLLAFDPSYPDTPPRILGTASTASRGEGKLAIDVLEDILQRTYTPSAVCLFEVINEAVETFQELNIGGSTIPTNNGNINNHNDPARANTDVHTSSTPAHTTTSTSSTTNTATTTTSIPDLTTLSLRDTFGIDTPPQWTLSDIVTEKKSVFVARAVHVTSLDQAQGYLDYLLATEKKVAAATHNISAWRIRQVKKSGTGKEKDKEKGESTEMIVQDCDDDGETAAGGRLLHLMQLMDVWDVVVVVTRWYGGVLLGPDRFRIINAVGRDALVKGGFGKEKEKESSGEKGGKKKGRK
ncbi:hypothetical protein FE257_012947 [Aspergillus nanangensis]|uniref:RWD domain-containing protein n=1 Tax=Aspergillus nanangensis TaxID=2582783 RepID=A0AAD4CF89_ASPNN|nr:hypothetical protein FE257_012947 [Aspergillus nanangensis]